MGSMWITYTASTHRRTRQPIIMARKLVKKHCTIFSAYRSFRDRPRWCCAAYTQPCSSLHAWDIFLYSPAHALAFTWHTHQALNTCKQAANAHGLNAQAHASSGHRLALAEAIWHVSTGGWAAQLGAQLRR